MKFVQQLFLYISITSLFFLLIGLFKPWIMLWWEDIQNRRKVFSIYGLIALVSFVIYLGVRVSIQ
jgi:hypothetical protein